MIVMLKLLSEHLQVICTHAESTYPEECCGLLLGKMTEEGKMVVEVLPTENAWSAETADEYPESELEMSRRRRYVIAPFAMLQAQRQARDRDLNIIGIYHSHPDHPAIPSECDRLSAWQSYSYIIVSVPQGKAGELCSWTLDDAHQFQSEKFITVEADLKNQ